LFENQYLDYLSLPLCASLLTLPEEWHTDHGVALGDPMYLLFNDTLRFVEEYPSEVLVLEVSHFMGGINPETLDALATMIMSYFGPYMLPPSQGFDITIADMVASGMCVHVCSPSLFDATQTIVFHHFGF
jgi:hypothetical protein